MQLSQEIRNTLLAVYNAPTADEELTKLYIEAFVDVADSIEERNNNICMICTGTMVSAVDFVRVNCIVCCINCRNVICYDCMWRSASFGNRDCPTCHEPIMCLRLTTDQHIVYHEAADLIALDNIARYGNPHGFNEYDDNDAADYTDDTDDNDAAERELIEEPIAFEM